MSPETPAVESVDETDHVGVQLDALAGMVARQGQALSPGADAPAEAPAPAPAAEVIPDAPTAEAEHVEAMPAADVTPETKIDPLTAPLAAITDAEPVATTLEPTAPTATPAEAAKPTPLADVEPADAEPADLLEPSVAGPEVSGTAGRASAILRPAQLLIVATAAINLIVVGLDAVLVTPSGSMTTVVLGFALITLAVWTGAAVTFLHWVSRADAHVSATAASPQRHGPSMSLLGWFIPIAGFVIGYRVLQDLWTGSDPATRDQMDAAPAKVRSIDLWVLGIVTSALFGYAMPLALGESALWAGLSALGLMVAALSLATTMGSISTWQLDLTIATDEATTSDRPGDATETVPGQDAPSATQAPQPVAVAAE